MVHLRNNVLVDHKPNSVLMHVPMDSTPLNAPISCEAWLYLGWFWGVLNTELRRSLQDWYIISPVCLHVRLFALPR